MILNQLPRSPPFVVVSIKHTTRNVNWA